MVNDMVSTIKEILDKLSVEEHRLLMYAFEHSLGQFVKINGNEFVGVNVEKIQHLKIESQVGVWATGTIISGEANEC